MVDFCEEIEFSNEVYCSEPVKAIWCLGSCIKCKAVIGWEAVIGW